MSPYLFILCVEVLSLAINANNNIHGITVSNSEVKTVQYVDDTILFLDDKETSLKTSLVILDNFSKVSGFEN